MDEEMTEIVDAVIPRVDLVGRAANGTRFLLAKSFAADEVRDLIEKADEEFAVDAVEKADPVVNVAEVIADAPAGSTADTVPGSPDWEEKDAETAWNTLGALSRLRAVVEWLKGREAQEAASGDGDDLASVWTLEDACAALDYAIDTLAPFAAGEKLEADVEAETLEAIGKAAALIGDLTVVEPLGPIVKAGRVLSAKNETLLRDAATNLNQVLEALPSAPESVEKKEETVTDETTTEPVEKADSTIEKATAMTAVFDQSGRLIGAVKPDQIVPLDAGSTAPDKDEPDASDLEAAPHDEVGVPADEANDAPAEEPVEKSSITADTPVDVLVKSAEDSNDPLVKRLAEAVKAKDEQITELLKAPAPGGPIVSGAPIPTVLRGQDNGSENTDTGRVADLRKQMTSADTVKEREAAHDELQKLATSRIAEALQLRN